MKSLRSRIVLTVFIAAFAVFAMSFLLVASVLQFSTQNRLDSMTEVIAKNGGEFPAREEYESMGGSSGLFRYTFTEEVPYRIRYFTVYFKSGEPPVVMTDHIASVNAELAVDMARSVLDGNRETGYYGGYRFRVVDDPEGAVFLDASFELESMGSSIWITALVELLFVLLIMMVFSAMSWRVVKPFEDNAAAQRQFITDASHELKTPVAIISANAEVLSYKDGDSEWVRSIVEQTHRMDDLINEMLMLSRLEESETLGAGKMEKVDVAHELRSSISEFDEVFKARKIEVSSELAENATVNANLSQVRRLCSILLGNASKYADENGQVKVTLKRSARYLTLTVFNTCEVEPDIDYEHLFDRFYRPDSSRASSTGGHGIGLSIAKRIVEIHGGSISAKPGDDGMTFTATISTRLKAVDAEDHPPRR